MKKPKVGEKRPKSKSKRKRLRRRRRGESRCSGVRSQKSREEKEIKMTGVPLEKVKYRDL